MNVAIFLNHPLPFDVKHHTLQSTNLKISIIMAVTVITTEAEFEKAIGSGKLVLVDFFATWCPPCKVLAPYLEKYSQEYPEVGFYKIDVEQLTDLAERQKVTGMPTVIYYKNGEEIDRVLGDEFAEVKEKIIKHSEK